MADPTPTPDAVAEMGKLAVRFAQLFAATGATPDEAERKEFGEQCFAAQERLKEFVTTLAADRDRLKAENERMRPVVEAAINWVDYRGTQPWFETDRIRREAHAYRAATAPPEPPDGGDST